MTNPLRILVTVASLVALSSVGACSTPGGSGFGGVQHSQDVRAFSVDEVGLSFDLPSDWTEFDREKMQDAMRDSTTMDELTDRMGMSREQFEQMMSSNIDLFVTAPHAVGGFLDNANVIVIDGKLPSVGAFELQYRALGATNIHSVEARTDVGDGYSMSYSLQLKEMTVRGVGMALAFGNQVVIISLSGHDVGETQQLASQVLESLEETR